MILILKQLLKIYNLNDPYIGGLSSYALTLMVAAFLQHQVLISNGMAYGQNFHYNFDHRDLVTALSEFLRHYGYVVNFSNTVIQP